MQAAKHDWFFFDLDGTLWDHDGASERAINGLCEEWQLPASLFPPLYRQANMEVWRERQTVATPVGVMRVRRFERALERLGAQAAGVDPRELSARYLELYLAQPALLPGAREVLRTAATLGRVAVVTNGFVDTQEVKLTHFAEDAALFSFMVCANEQVGLKPQLPIFRAALELAGEPRPEAVVMVGDTWAEDIVTPATLGWSTVWISYGRQAPPEPTGVQVVERTGDLAGLLSTFR